MKNLTRQPDDHTVFGKTCLMVNLTKVLNVTVVGLVA